MSIHHTDRDRQAPRIIIGIGNTISKVDRDDFDQRAGGAQHLEKSGAVSELSTVVNLGLHAERMFARRGITIDAVLAKLKK